MGLHHAYHWQAGQEVFHPADEPIGQPKTIHSGLGIQALRLTDKFFLPYGPAELLELREVKQHQHKIYNSEAVDKPGVARRRKLHRGTLKIPPGRQGQPAPDQSQVG